MKYWFLKHLIEERKKRCQRLFNENQIVNMVFANFSVLRLNAKNPNGLQPILSNFKIVIPLKKEKERTIP